MKHLKELFDKNSSEIQLGALISMIHRSYMFYINHSLKDLDITAAQIPFLYYISKNKDISQEDLAFKFNIDKGAVARAIKRMNDQNIILREIDTENRRRYKLSLTSKGELISKKINEINDKWENNVCDSISILNNEELKDLFKKIACESILSNRDIINNELGKDNE
ncbi:MarR family winged helix-turn-helix transcriptional regulator [Methanobrevibacter filiformis]|nr:MarR family transcriptional regulator [Methanobrevibacter filiformis]